MVPGPHLGARGPGGSSELRQRGQTSQRGSGDIEGAQLPLSLMPPGCTPVEQPQSSRSFLERPRYGLAEGPRESGECAGPWRLASGICCPAGSRGHGRPLPLTGLRWRSLSPSPLLQPYHYLIGFPAANPRLHVVSLESRDPTRPVLVLAGGLGPRGPGPASPLPFQR